MTQLKRTAPYETESQELKEHVRSLLIRSTNEEFQRLDSVRARLLKRATIIPLTSNILQEASTQRARGSIESPQDAVVYASILHHLAAEPSEMSCFINRNKRDFDAPEIGDELLGHGCKILFDFNAGRNYVIHCVSSNKA